MRSLLCAAAILTAATIPAVAQETANAKSGAETRVGWIGSVGENCVANPAPTVKPTKVADHGQIKLTKGEVQTNSVPACPGVKVPAIVVFYKSSSGYKGSDSFTLAVGDSERTYTVAVE